MQIQRIQDNTHKSPSFKDYSHFVYKNPMLGHSVSNIQNSSRTWFMRGCPTVRERAEILFRVFKDAPKVNIYDFGCSDGSDTLSLLLALHYKGGPEALTKFGPIIGRDIRGEAIYHAEEGIYTLNPEEISEIDKLTCGAFETYFYSPYYTGDKLRTGKWKIRDFIKSKTNFDVGDIRKDYKIIEPYNSFVQARNFWPYLNVDDRYELAKNLHSQMKGNSLLVIGAIDKEDPFHNKPAHEIITAAGFIPTEIDYIYKK